MRISSPYWKRGLEIPYLLFQSLINNLLMKLEEYTQGYGTWVNSVYSCANINNQNFSIISRTQITQSQIFGGTQNIEKRVRLAVGGGGWGRVGFY